MSYFWMCTEKWQIVKKSWAEPVVVQQEVK